MNPVIRHELSRSAPMTGDAWNLVVSGLGAMWDASLPWIVGGVILVFAVLVTTLLVPSVKRITRFAAGSASRPGFAGKRPAPRNIPSGRKLRWAAVAVATIVVASIAAASFTTAVEDDAAQVRATMMLPVPPTADPWTALQHARR
jgi:hypothetical protein